jgi:hypothetical protein
LDESAVLAYMAYVDLNPIRAKVDSKPERSKHNSIQQRIHCLIKGEQPRKLMGFAGDPRYDMPKGIAYSLIDYCELVDCTGRCIRDDKAGYIEQHHSPEYYFNTPEQFSITHLQSYMHNQGSMPLPEI